jgi:hypothetical protein
MGRMADTVLKKSNAAEKELERRAVQYAIELDEKKKREEKDKVDKARRRDQEIKYTLDKQIDEKKKQREMELENNKKYIEMVID